MTIFFFCYIRINKCFVIINYRSLLSSDKKNTFLNKIKREIKICMCIYIYKDNSSLKDMNNG